MVSLAWRGFPLIRLLLRPLYIGVLATVLWMATHDTPTSKHEVIVWVSTTWLAFAPIFYFGYLLAGLVRDSLLRRFYSERQQIIYLRRQEWRRYIWRLVRGQDELRDASNRDY